MGCIPRNSNSNRNYIITMSKFTERLDKIFTKLQEYNPNPRTELRFTNEYQFLIAIVLSAQATDKQVNKVTSILFPMVKTPQDVMDLGEEKLLEYVKSIGLYKTKAKNIMILSKDLIEKYNNKIPETREELITLAGVGFKTASVWLNSVLDQPTIAVDTHVFRVSHRLGMSSEKNRDKMSVDLENKIPERWALNAHHWMILHGRYVCKARRPECEKCIVYEHCEWDEKSTKD